MKKRIIVTVIGVVLIVLGLSWNALFVPPILDWFESSAQEGDGEMTGEGGEDTAMLEGEFGTIELLWDILTGNDLPSDPGSLSMELFEMRWEPVAITSEGLTHAQTGEPLFPTETGTESEMSFGSSFSMDRDQLFPLFGVEPRDYRIAHPFFNRSVVARYGGETDVDGRAAYCYEVNITDANLSMDAFMPAMGGDGGADDGELIPGLSFAALTIGYRELTRYYIDPVTSIPLDLEMRMILDLTLPDLTLLQVEEGETVERTETELWVPNGTLPGTYEKRDVIAETHTLVELDPADRTVARFDRWIVYYDAETGEKLAEEYQGEHERFAVNRRSYQYIDGYGNSARAGYYTFPLAAVEPMDYPMWDDVAQSNNVAAYIGTGEVLDRPVYIYEMTTDEVVLETGNALLPVYRHPGTQYLYSGKNRWSIDAATGFLLDYAMNGTVSVRSAGPFQLVTQTVESFGFDMGANQTQMLRNVSLLYEDLIIPLSGRQLSFFGIDLAFSATMRTQLASAAVFLGRILRLVRLWIPLLFVVVGATLVVLAVAAHMTVRRRERRGDGDEPGVASRREVVVVEPMG